MRQLLIILQQEYTKIENRITFKVKARYYLRPLTPETMKLL